MSELSLAAALIVAGVAAVAITCLVVSAGTWLAVRVLDVVFGAIETVIRQIASRR